jgi:hypothetical protein
MLVWIGVYVACAAVLEGWMLWVAALSPLFIVLLLLFARYAHVCMSMCLRACYQMHASLVNLVG